MLFVVTNIAASKETLAGQTFVLVHKWSVSTHGVKCTADINKMEEYEDWQTMT